MHLFKRRAKGQRTEAPATLDSQPEGREATPPSRDPDDAAAPGAGAHDATDLNAGAVSRPEPPEGLAGP